MRSIKNVCILFLFVCQQIYAANENTTNGTEVNGEKKLDPRIVGGTKAIKGQFRGIVSIQLKTGGSFYHFCGGTLYKNSENRSYVLTAAHCITEDVKPKTIRIVGDDLNNSDKSTDTKRQIRKVKSIHVHPDYLSTINTIINDLAIISLAKPFQVTETFGPVSLPQNDVFDGQSCSVAGWGKLYQESKESPSYLYAVDIKVIPRKVCIPPLNNVHAIVGPNVVCAGSMSGGRDSCQGDSGGPLICNSIDGERKLFGVVSWGLGCAQPNFVGLYTNVYRYKDWIETNNSSPFNPMISLLISSIGILILNFIF